MLFVLFKLTQFCPHWSLNFMVRIKSSKAPTVFLGKLSKISNLKLVNIIPFFLVWLSLFSLPVETSLCFEIWHSNRLLQRKTGEKKHCFKIFLICMSITCLFFSEAFLLVRKTTLCYNVLPASTSWSCVSVVDYFWGRWMEDKNLMQKHKMKLISKSLRGNLM